MRVPLAQVADMATYIAKNKIRPKPEWQKNVAPTEDLANPFKIVHTQIPSAKSDRSRIHDQQALPAGDDARAPARMQPHLHRLWPHPRIRRQHSRPGVAGKLPESGGRVRRAHGFDLRRRAAAAARHRCDVRGSPEARTLHSALQRRCSCAKTLEGFLRPIPTWCSMFTWTAWRRITTSPSNAGVFKEAIDGVRAAKEGGFKVFSNTTVFKETDMKEIWQLFEYLEQFGVDGHSDFPGLRLLWL